MSEYIGLPNDNLHDILFRELEDIDKCNDYLYDSLPYPLRDSELKRVFGYLPEESTDGFICMESLDSGDDVVLQGYDGRMCNQFGKVPSLTLSHSEQLLCLLVYDFLRPAAAVDSVRLEEIYSGVGGNQASPWTVLAASDEEQTHIKSVMLDISSYVPAFEIAAIFHLLAVFKMSDTSETYIL